jgi:hypothetical protein
VTQEVASKGLVMVYELGDAGMKRELVDNLVATLATGKAKQAAEVQRKDETYSTTSCVGCGVWRVACGVWRVACV